MQKQEYILTSKNVKCLVSNRHIENVDLQCYCNWGNSLNYRLDKETAVARISELKQSDEGRCVVSVEHIDKIAKADLEAVRQATTMEWKTVLTHTQGLNQAILLTCHHREQSSMRIRCAKFGGCIQNRNRLNAQTVRDDALLGSFASVRLWPRTSTILFR